jgi:hypothetical protein
MGQAATGRLTEERVKRRLEGLGLCVRKPHRGCAVDIHAWHPSNPSKLLRIEVKGRNPDKVTSYRWFQIRVSKSKLERARHNGVQANQTWLDEVSKADFFVLDAAKIDEMWVLSQKQVLDLIQYNESKYADRPDNVFTYSDPIKAKQKEMNLDIEVDGTVLTEHFRECLDNFEPIMTSLRDD